MLHIAFIFTATPKSLPSPETTPCHAPLASYLASKSIKCQVPRNHVRPHRIAIAIDKLCTRTVGNESIYENVALQTGNGGAQGTGGGWVRWRTTRPTRYSTDYDTEVLLHERDEARANAFHHYADFHEEWIMT